MKPLQQSAVAFVFLAASCSTPSPAPHAPTAAGGGATPASTEAPVPYEPEVVPASGEGALAIHRFRVPERFRVELVAAEPMLANPVALDVDDQGRFFVAETFRHSDGVTDTRDHMEWRDDDLACRTVDDRLAMYRRYLGDAVRDYAREHDRVRLVEDVDRDGVADRATVFSDGYKSAAAGIGAGLLARDGKVWYTCIPDLWLLEDRDGDGRAEKKESLHTGYGVHVGYLGHDLHGLCYGPDGRIYFSIGDRGIHVETEGKVIDNPDSGSVLRCNPDGSDLEVFATGFRNPQELAFDEYGNLFTADNDSDGGDKPRWVYLVEGGDSGWRIGYQFIRAPVSRGPWSEEKLWLPRWKGQAAWIIPPVANLAKGPSGLAYYPGTGFHKSYDQTFFLCDFRGDSGRSGIRTVKIQPHGASFRLAKEERFLWSILATDADFGPDGALYVTDWVEGWGKTGKGRIYKVFDASHARREETLQVSAILARGMKNRPIDELGRLLKNKDMRVRQRAQFELVRRGQPGAAELERAALDPSEPMARLHGIWGLAQILRTRSVSADIIAVLLEDPEDARVRAQAARAVGDARLVDFVPHLIRQLRDDSSRVRFFAALNLSKLRPEEAIGPLCDMLRENDDRDVYLRHAGVMGLAGVGDVRALLESAADESPAVRLGIVLALRRLVSPEIARFLDDSEPRIVAEAARAINDVPIPECTGALAAVLGRGELEDPVVLRAINANFRLGAPEHAAVLARFVEAGVGSDRVLLEALEALADWAEPSGRDRVIGLWRPLDARSPEPAASALASIAPVAASAPSARVRQRVVELLGAYRVESAAAVVRDIVLDGQQPGVVRAAAFDSLSATAAGGLGEILDAVVQSPHPELRMAGHRALAQHDAEEVVKVLDGALRSGEVAEKQGALAILGGLPSKSADDLLLGWMQRLQADAVPAELRLDVLEAASRRSRPEIQQRVRDYEAQRQARTGVAQYRDVLAGGDPERGVELFRSVELSCTRCHRVGRAGTFVGPELTGVGSRRDPEYLLESLIDPGRQITEGFETVVVVRRDGKVITGVIEGENDRGPIVRTPEGNRVFVPIEDILKETRGGASTMPADLVKDLSMRELRDLMAYLTSLKADG